MKKTTKRASPHGLGTAGARLWREIVDAYELRPDELRLLEDACRTADVIDELHKAMRDQPLTTPGVKNQARMNPLMVEIRQQRLALAAFLRQLGLPDEKSESAPNDHQTNSVRARSAANARWGRPTNGAIR